MYTQFLAASFLLINILSYCTMWYDKKQAIKHKQRIPEITLFLLAFVMGAIGIYLAMKAPIYHKAAKWKFKIIIPILILANIVCMYYILKY